MAERSELAVIAPSADGSDLVAWLENLSKDDVPRAGGKGANLGELTRAGLPVPPGFVVTSDAYLRAMEAGGVRAGLLDEVAAADVDDPLHAVAGRGAAAGPRPLGRDARRPASCGPRRVCAAGRAPCRGPVLGDR